MLHLKLLRSPHAHARIKAIRKDAALAVPGVCGVYTWEDVPRRAVHLRHARRLSRRSQRHLPARQRRAFCRSAGRGSRRGNRGRGGRRMPHDRNRLRAAARGVRSRTSDEQGRARHPRQGRRVAHPAPGAEYPARNSRQRRRRRGGIQGRRRNPRGRPTPPIASSTRISKRIARSPGSTTVASTSAPAARRRTSPSRSSVTFST